MPDIDSIAKTFMGTPQGLKIIKGLDKFNTTMNSPQGKELLVLLAGSGSDIIKQAATAAVAANGDPGRVLVSTLFSSKEGAALAAKIIEVIGA